MFPPQLEQDPLTSPANQISCVVCVFKPLLFLLHSPIAVHKHGFHVSPFPPPPCSAEIPIKMPAWHNNPSSFTQLLPALSAATSLPSPVQKPQLPCAAPPFVPRAPNTPQRSQVRDIGAEKESCSRGEGGSPIVFCLFSFVIFPHNYRNEEFNLLFCQNKLVLTLEHVWY